jgi:isopenicillin-N epimerase
MAVDSDQASLGHDWSTWWSLNPAIAFLNHGSFGACPKPVLARQQQLRDRMESNPLQFMRQLESLLDEARADLTAFMGADFADLVFVPNATTGVNTVLRSLSWQPNDEILVTDQGYNACCNAVEFVAQQFGAQVVVAAVPFPLQHPDQVVQAVMSCVSSRTKLAVLDHVASPTGLVFPIAELVQKLAAQGIDTLVDGAHAPGMVSLDLTAIGATYYTGNCHKWLCAPKGAAFLHIRSDKQDTIRPLTISHGANSPRRDRARLLLEFDWTGTYDPTPYLCIPKAIQFMGGLLPGGWSALHAHNRALVLAARETVAPCLGVVFPTCPTTMIGAMAALPLSDEFPEQLQAILFEEFKIEVPVPIWPASPQLLKATGRSHPTRLLRLSAQIYNTHTHYERLAGALATIQSRYST